MPRPDISLARPNDEDLSVELFNLQNGNSETKVTLNGNYGFQVVQDFLAGLVPDFPLQGSFAYGFGAYGIEFSAVQNTATGQNTYKISGSINGIGVNGEFVLDQESNLISSSGFAGVQIIGGKKGAVVGFSLGAEGIVRLGLEIDRVIKGVRYT